MHSELPPTPGTGDAHQLGRRDLLRLSTLIAAGGLAALVPADLARADTRHRGTQSETTTYRGNSPYGFDQWASVDFTVPDGVRRLSVTYDFDGTAGVLDIGIFGPTGFRGWSGSARREFTLSGSDATPGYVPGPVQSGQWSVALGPMVNKSSGMDWQVSVTLEYGDPLPVLPYDALPAAVPGRGAGWYRGDLHLHTVHSDGQRTVEHLIADARRAKLDFIATSDHNTSSTGVSWRGNVPADLLVLNAEEVTTRHGHWLAVGLPQGEWVDWHYAPSDAGVLDKHIRRLHSLGGLAVVAHPLTPGPGAFWEFGLDRVDAMEVWNGPWTLDDAANIALWHAMLCLGKRIAGLGNSDAHSPGDVVGEPHNVVHAAGLSAPALLDALRRGRSYAVESANVTVDLTAGANGAAAGPGEELPLSFFDAVDVTVDVTGAPDAVITLHTEWGIMAAKKIDGSGRGRLHWRGWGKASLFARAEVRRLKPASTTLDQMVAITNPVWFHPAGLPPYPIEERTFFQTERRPDGSWSSMRPLPGPGSAPTFTGVQASVAGMPDGSVQALGIGTDNKLWFTMRKGSATIQPWQQLAGPDGQAAFAVREAAITGFADGTSQIVVTGMDGTVYHRQRRATGAWAGFRQVPGNQAAGRWGATKVAIAGMPDGSAQVLGYGTDGSMYHCIRRSSGSWSGWGRLAGFNGAPAFAGPALAITGMPDGASQVLAIGLDGMVYHTIRRPDGSWTGFQPPRGVTTPTMGASAVDIAGMPDGSAQVVAVGRDGNVWHQIRRPDGSWTGFARMPGPNGRDPFPAGQARITALRDGTAHVLGISAG
ncbi:CehA/McbA family metallohydrolase [Streptomyces sp. NPDC051211]|uniref:CehA/McbA family metallohydrolase n=1 Tax=Streptomyces sp. NPDC051211 TaxID=3154643 RepID=UPI00344E01ED